MNYTPFLFTREVPSMGKSSRIKGWKTGRVHHFLSSLESNYFYVLEWSLLVLDIREQYPLPLDATQEIADRLSIKHPFNVKAKEPAVLTTDFLIDVENAGDTVLKARSIKYASDLNDLRTLEKLEIERTYWIEQGVDWGIVTELEVPLDLAKNIEWLHSALDPSEAPGLSPKDISFLENELYDQLSAKPTEILAHIGMEFDKRLGLRGGTALWVVRHLIASRQWEVEMTGRISPRQSLKIKRTAGVLSVQGEILQ